MWYLHAVVELDTEKAALLRAKPKVFAGNDLNDDNLHRWTTGKTKRMRSLRIDPLL